MAIVILHDQYSKITNQKICFAGIFVQRSGWWDTADGGGRAGRDHC